MSKLNSTSRSLELAATSELDSKSSQRLIVLVPYFEADPTPLARRVWELANAMGTQVQFIALYSDLALESSLRRQLICMAAMINDDRISVEIDVIFGKDWLDAVKWHRQAGDIIVCLAEQRVGLLRKPLNQILQSDLYGPIYILSGLFSQNDLHSNWPVYIAAWAGFIAILFAFFLLQVKIDQLVKDWIQIFLFILSIPLEIWTIWVWNKLFD